MPAYMVYWPQDRLKVVQKAGDTGPIKVVYGSIHAKMPTIASIKVGDVVFPLTLMDKHLYVLARLPVECREPAIDYTLRELGRPCGALEHEGNVYPKFEYRDSWCPTLPYQEHQMPFNCCSKWAVSGEHGSSIKLRQLPDELLPSLRFGYPKSKEKGLLFDKKGNVMSSCLCATRRLTPETQEVFEALFENEG